MISPSSLRALKEPSGDHPAVQAALAQLNHCDHFIGRLATIRISYDHGRLVLEGSVPSFYLKSVLQTAIGQLPDCPQVVNRVDVVSCEGLSSPPHHLAKEAPR